MKSVQIRSFFWSVFSCIWTEYGALLRKFPYSVQIQENTDQKKLRIWTLFTQWRSKLFPKEVRFTFPQYINIFLKHGFSFSRIYKITYNFENIFTVFSQIGVKNRVLEFLSKILQPDCRIALNSFMMESLLYRNQSIDLLCKPIDRFLYDRDLSHERVKVLIISKSNVCYNVFTNGPSKICGGQFL